jgi:hypothetical protein
LSQPNPPGKLIAKTVESQQTSHQHLKAQLSSTGKPIVKTSHQRPIAGSKHRSQPQNIMSQPIRFRPQADASPGDSNMSDTIDEDAGPFPTGEIDDIYGVNDDNPIQLFACFLADRPTRKSQRKKHPSIYSLSSGGEDENSSDSTDDVEEEDDPQLHSSIVHWQQQSLSLASTPEQAPLQRKKPGRKPGSSKAVKGPKAPSLKHVPQRALMAHLSPFKGPSRD